MKIKWLGHAAFLITADDGTRIITDPYITTDELKYDSITQAADIVTVSHEHFDHNNTDPIQGNPAVLRESAEARGIRFTAILSWHDENRGSERGDNRIFCFTVNGVRICHLGDLGHMLSPAELAAVGQVDVLLEPVGGFYTIDAATATRVAQAIGPRIIIPMHFRNERCHFPITGVDEFLKGKPDITDPNLSEVSISPAELGETTRIIVLKPAM